MTLQTLIDGLPDYARELRSNMVALMADRILDDQRRYGLLLSCAHGTGYRPIVEAAEAECAGRLSPEAANAARGAAASMAMTNVYFRFVHLVSDPGYAAMPSRLRRNMLGHAGVAKADVELFALAVSVMNGCGLCIDSHEEALKAHGVGAEVVQIGARFAAVIKAIATVHATL